MPCMQCANGMWKYGEHGNCQFTSKSKCEEAAAAIHAKPEKQEDYITELINDRSSDEGT